MGKKFRNKVASTQSAKALRAEFKEAFDNALGYMTGAMESLADQLGQVMAVQGAMVDYVTEKDPAAAERIKQIIEEHRAKFEAEMAAQKEAAEALKAKKADEPEETEESQPADIVPSEATDVGLPQTN